MKVKNITRRLTLIILIAISLVFTWIIWFNPSQLEHRATTNVSVKSTTETKANKRKDAVFLPAAVYREQNGVKTLLVSDDRSMSGNVHTALKTARVAHVNQEKKLSSDAYDALLTRDATVQMVYTDKMSWRLFNGLFFNKVAKKTGREFEFTRILIDLRHETISLLNDSKRTVRQLTFSTQPKYAAVTRALKKATDHFTIQETRMHGREVALYTQSVSVQPYSYLVDQQGTNHYISALMGNSEKSTSSVDAKQVGTQTFYTVNNNNQRLTTDKDDNKMVFGNFATGKPKQTRRGVLTDAYTQMMTLAPTTLEGVRYASYDETERTVTFRTYVGGLAVFDDTMNGTVSVTRTSSSLSMTFSSENLSVPVPTRESKVTLPATATALANVRNHGFTNGEITDIQLGYRWEKDDDSTLVIDLVPTYYVALEGTYYDYSDILNGKVTEETIHPSTSKSGSQLNSN
mgnify:CR=1 FL=1